MTNNSIRLIWDFRGPTSRETAAHFEKHLREYLLANGHESFPSGCEYRSESWSYCYIRIPEERLEQFRDDLRPHRGERD